ncbi:MAG: hypothetical protein N3A38_09130 [Planctomycetota bacterium]|nr:hypothetical protein [Planctomycetota bacterium]
MTGGDLCYGDNVRDYLIRWFNEGKSEPPTDWSFAEGIKHPKVRTVRGVGVSSGAGMHAAGFLREEEGRFTAEVWLPAEGASGGSEVIIPKIFFIVPDAEAEKAIKRLDEIGIWERRQPIESFMNSKVITLDALGYWHAAISRERSNFFDVPVLERQINPALLEIIRIYDDLLFGRRLQETRVLPERLPTTLKDENDFEICGEITLEEEENREDQE